MYVELKGQESLSNIKVVRDAICVSSLTVL